MAAQRIICDDIEAQRLQVHKKTQLCKFFAVGACQRGSNCAFAHGTSQLRQQPDYSKTRLCADFMELGRCAQGRDCKFAHGKRELRPGSAAKVGRPSGRSTQAAQAPKPETEEAKTVVQALETLRKRQLHHERAAMNLMLQGTLAGVASLSGKGKASPDLELPETSFSRQTTWEGVETVSTGFSRAFSDASDASMAEKEICEAAVRDQLVPLPKAQVTGWQVRVKNTFIEVQDDEDIIEPVMLRTKSLPCIAEL